MKEHTNRISQQKSLFFGCQVMGSTRAWIGCLAPWQPRSDVDWYLLSGSLCSCKLHCRVSFPPEEGLMLGASACSVVDLGSMHLDVKQHKQSTKTCPYYKKISRRQKSMHTHQ